MINSVGNYYRPVAYQSQTQTQTQPNFTGKENKKEGMSKTSKTLLGLGALAAVGIGGLLLKRRIDANAIEKLIKKPEVFDEKYFKNFVQEWTDKLKLPVGDKFNLVCVPKSKMEDFISANSDGSSFIQQFKKVLAQLTDDGFCMIINSSSLNNPLIKYFNPKNITHKNMLEAFKNNKIYKQSAVITP